jgi:hypothetical protein
MTIHRLPKRSEPVADRDPEIQEVRDALAQVLGERKIRVMSRATRIRQLVLYSLLVLLLAYVTAISVQANRNQHALIANCYAVQTNARNFNALVDRIVNTYATSPVLSPAQRQSRIAFFDGAKQTVPKCPPIGIE